MKLLVFSDLHLNADCLQAVLAAADTVDLILGAGDYAQRREGLADVMQALEPLSERLIPVPGNNETEEELRAATSAAVLHGQSIKVDGLTIAGIGGAVPPLPPMAWGSFDVSEAAAASMLGSFDKADILISHSPPKGIGDLHAGMGSIGSVPVILEVTP